MIKENVISMKNKDGCTVEYHQYFSTDDDTPLGECWKRYDNNDKLVYVEYSTGVVKTYCYDDNGNLKDFYDPSVHGAINAIRIFTDYSEGYDIKAELAFSYGGTKIISWIRPAERDMYEPGINGYTLFFDEREKAPFEKQKRPIPV